MNMIIALYWYGVIASKMKIPILMALVIVSAPVMLAYAQSGTIEADGSILTFNGSRHSGLWAANIDLENNTGNIVSVFKNEDGDIFVITVRAVEVDQDDDLTMSGKGFVAMNGELLKEGDGSVLITKNRMEIRVNGDIVISGKTLSFEMK